MENLIGKERLVFRVLTKNELKNISGGNWLTEKFFYALGYIDGLFASATQALVDEVGGPSRLGYTKS